MNEILYFRINETPLFAAVKNENIEIVKLLLTDDKIDVNILNVLINFYYKINIMYFNDIEKFKFNDIYKHMI